jgi:hypothetical protein
MGRCPADGIELVQYEDTLSVSRQTGEAIGRGFRQAQIYTELPGCVSGDTPVKADGKTRYILLLKIICQFIQDTALSVSRGPMDYHILPLINGFNDAGGLLPGNNGAVYQAWTDGIGELPLQLFYGRGNPVVML